MTRAEKKAAKLAAEAAAVLVTETVIAATAETPLTEGEIVAVLETLPEAPPASTDAATAIEGVVAEIEAAAEVEKTPTQDFGTILKSITDEDALIMAHKAGAAIDERMGFEKVKDPTNEKIQNYLKATRAKMVTPSAARVLIATNVDPSILNRSVHEGARYNVYAMGKLSDIIGAVTADKFSIGNAINNACMRSLFRFKAGKVQFTGEMAKAACSDKIRVDRAIGEMLLRHTVSASTAPTQASSSMQAFETLGIVKRTGSQKNPNFDLTDAPITAMIERAIAA
jgi:hypothetical protein